MKIFRNHLAAGLPPSPYQFSQLSNEVLPNDFQDGCARAWSHVGEDKGAFVLHCIPWHPPYIRSHVCRQSALFASAPTLRPLRSLPRPGSDRWLWSRGSRVRIPSVALRRRHRRNRSPALGSDGAAVTRPSRPVQVRRRHRAGSRRTRSRRVARPRGRSIGSPSSTGTAA